jgi:hypothetical protein
MAGLDGGGAAGWRQWMDTWCHRAYLWLLGLRDTMAKNSSWGDKKGSRDAPRVYRSDNSGRWVGLRHDRKTAAGSALTQAEKVTRSLEKANRDTGTFKPKNAR